MLRPEPRGLIMRRRDFTILLGGAAVWPSSALAQPAKLPTIGFLGPGTSSAFNPWTAAFVQRLRELGWIEGRTIAIEYRWADGRTERFREIAAEFVRLKVDVIVTAGSAVPAVMQTTSTIPIVFAFGRSHWVRHDRLIGATGRQRDRPLASVERTC
jgi:putative tryptophan/tyrosine transport system substrate-binding protein